jgi:hypothetical protein
MPDLRGEALARENPPKLVLEGGFAMKIKVGCAIPLSGCRISDEIEVEDLATEAEIDEAVLKWALERFEYWWEDDDG